MHAAPLRLTYIVASVRLLARRAEGYGEPAGWFSFFSVSGAGLSFDGWVWLFSCGLTVERMTMNLLSRSNQKGAPCETARPVRMRPSSFSIMPYLSEGQRRGSDS